MHRSISCRSITFCKARIGNVRGPSLLSPLRRSRDRRCCPVRFLRTGRSNRLAGDRLTGRVRSDWQDRVAPQGGQHPCLRGLPLGRETQRELCSLLRGKAVEFTCQAHEVSFDDPSVRRPNSRSSPVIGWMLSVLCISSKKLSSVPSSACSRSNSSSRLACSQSTGC